MVVQLKKSTTIIKIIFVEFCTFFLNLNERVNNNEDVDNYSKNKFLNKRKRSMFFHSHDGLVFGRFVLNEALHMMLFWKFESLFNMLFWHCS